MPTSSSASDDRPIAGRVLRAQMGAGAVLSLACFAIWGRFGLVSALGGAGIALIANAYRTFKALQPARSARRALGQLYLAELVNFALTIALFLVAGRLPHVQWLALLLTYVGTMVALWWVPLVASARRG